MKRADKETMDQLILLFDRWNETIIWSCLQGYMGDAWVDDLQPPESAQLIVGDFCFFAGSPNIELVRNIPGNDTSDFLLMVPQNEEWSKLIEQAYSNNCKRTLRYAIKKEPGIFDRKRLEDYAGSIPQGYHIKAIDEALYHQTKGEAWSKDLCSQFPSYRDYQANGLGFMVFHGETPVSGASSYTVYDKGIEIEVDTKNEYRQKGLAIACAARLILECLDRELYPSWDAHDLRSVALAEKLGYHLEKSYVTYIISNT